jgi:hypothetical protein
MQFKSAFCVLALALAAVGGVALTTQPAEAVSVNQVLQSTATNNLVADSVGYHGYRGYYGHGGYRYRGYRGYYGYGGYRYGGYYGYYNYRGYYHYCR